MRPTIDETMIEAAFTMAKRGTCNRKQVGAVICVDTRPVSTGWVGSLPGKPHCTEVGCLLGPDGGCIRTQHAEANAIAFAARKGIALEGGTLYVTMSPCLPCAKLVAAAGVSKIVYAEKYRLTEGIEFLAAAGIETTLQEINCE